MNRKLFIAAAALVPLLALSPTSPVMAKTKAHHAKTTVGQIKTTKKHKKGVKSAKKMNSIVGTLSAFTDKGFSIDAGKRGTFDVELSDITKYVGPKKTTITLSDLQVGQRLAVKGKVDKKTMTVTGVSVVRELNASKNTSAALTSGGTQSDQNTQGDQDDTGSQADQDVPASYLN